MSFKFLKDIYVLDSVREMFFLYRTFLDIRELRPTVVGILNETSDNFS
jgi:hypothetical protein